MLGMFVKFVGGGLSVHELNTTEIRIELAINQVYQISLNITIEMYQFI